MTVNVDRLTIGNKTFSLNVLIANPDAYLPLMQPMFCANTFAQKPNENYERYLRRLFTLLYNRMNAAVASSSESHGTVRRAAPIRVEINENCQTILSALGIDIVKKCPKRSSVLFKSSGNRYRMDNTELNKLAEAVKHNVSYKPKKRLNDSSVSFGVELEFIGKKDQLHAFENAIVMAVGEGRYYNAGGYNKNEGKVWVLGKDMSVKPKGNQCGRGMRGYELTSPILNLGSKKDLSELATVCDIVKNIFNGEVNATCGTHIHMSFPVECASDELVAHFARSYRKSEASLFDKLVPKNRRENNAHYSGSVNVRHVWDRYRKLNFQHVKKNSDNMHLEFRQLNGTLDYDVIIAWAKLQKLFVNLTLDSWRLKCDDIEKPIKIELDDIIVSKSLNLAVTESLMKMGKLVA